MSTGLLCAGCLGEATIQLLSPEGMPCGTLCQPCMDESQRFHDSLIKMLEDAVRSLGEPEVPAGLRPKRKRGATCLG